MTLLRALLLIALAGALTACPLAREPARAPLWRISDGDTTIWLMGSIHLLPPRIDWHTDAVDRAMDADTLVLETDPTATGDFDAIAKAPGLPPLAKRVAADRQDALARAIERTGARIAWSARPRVLTSARRQARAVGGFADALLQALAMPAGGVAA